MTHRSQFLYGAATSAHQVEGNNIHNDWWEWEKRTAGITPSGKAVDHYRLFREDIQLAKSLGHNAHRISVEWSRIEPQKNSWNYAAVQHYQTVLQEMKDAGMETFVTLHHFTNPRWFSDSGGWTASDAPERFRAFTVYIVQHLGHLVDHWITINEPMVYATQAYWHGIWPPQSKDFPAMLRVIGNLASAHMKAFAAIHQMLPHASVGIAKAFVAYWPHRSSHPGDVWAAKVNDWWFNRRFLHITKGTHDFIGVNYYFGFEKKFIFQKPFFETVPWNGPTSDMKWPIRPEGLAHILTSLKEMHLPVYITENGIADASDLKRPDFIRSHLRAIEEAQREGVNVRGYLHWSLLDNFEWTYGMKPKFGLVAVDPKTMQRTPKPSAFVYKAIIEQAQRI